jgi:hypothetical protein
VMNLTSTQRASAVVKDDGSDRRAGLSWFHIHLNLVSLPQYV